MKMRKRRIHRAVIIGGCLRGFPLIMVLFLPYQHRKT